MYSLQIGKLLKQDFSTIKDASNAYQDLRDQLGLGASEFPDGKLRIENRKQVFRISYNGRVWDTAGNEVTFN